MEYDPPKRDVLIRLPEGWLRNYKRGRYVGFNWPCCPVEGCLEGLEMFHREERGHPCHWACPKHGEIGDRPKTSIQMLAGQTDRSKDYKVNEPSGHVYEPPQIKIAGTRKGALRLNRYTADYVLADLKKNGHRASLAKAA